MYVCMYWRFSQPGVDPSFGNLACLATLKSSDRMKQVSLWMTIYMLPYPCGFQLSSEGSNGCQ